MEPNSSSTHPLTIPMAIVVAGLLIAGAIFLSRGPTEVTPREQTAKANTLPVAASTEALAIRPVDASDHVRGNPEAPIVIVEYSDTECPFCQRFHGTLKQVIDEYGKSGKVSWVYRHFPLTQIHSKAVKEAEALECAAALGGNGTFWEYTDELFRVTPTNNGLDLRELPRIAARVGLEESAFTACLESGQYTSRIQTDLNEAVNAGGNGTPYNILLLSKKVSETQENTLRALNQDLLQQLPAGSPDAIVISSDKRKVSIGGAFQYPLMKQIVELLLQK